MTDPRDDAPTDPITEGDLLAYVDGQLPAMRRVEVEAHLARHPDDAARVMGALRDRDALRQAYLHQADLHQADPHRMALHRAGARAPGAGPARLRAGARRLDRALAWQRVGARLRRAAVIAVLVGAGWLAHTDTGTFGVPGTAASTVDPALVEEALQARQAVLVRARAASQRPSAAYDRADLEAATGLALPPLPADWRVRDVQVFPTRAGTGIEVSVTAAGLGDLSLFATAGTAAAIDAGTVARSPDGATAYWQSGHTVFALSGPGDGPGLQDAAAGLAAARP